MYYCDVLMHTIIMTTIDISVPPPSKISAFSPCCPEEVRIGSAFACAPAPKAGVGLGVRSSSLTVMVPHGPFPGPARKQQERN